MPERMTEDRERLAVVPCVTMSSAHNGRSTVGSWTEHASPSERASNRMVRQEGAVVL